MYWQYRPALVVVLTITTHSYGTSHVLLLVQITRTWAKWAWMRKQPQFFVRCLPVLEAATCAGFCPGQFCAKHGAGYTVNTNLLAIASSSAALSAYPTRVTGRHKRGRQLREVLQPAGGHTLPFDIELKLIKNVQGCTQGLCCFSAERCGAFEPGSCTTVGTVHGCGVCFVQGFKQRAVLAGKQHVRLFIYAGIEAGIALPGMSKLNSFCCCCYCSAAGCSTAQESLSAANFGQYDAHLQAKMSGPATVC